MRKPKKARTPGPAQGIIAKLGGLRRAANITALPSSTVQYWHDCGFIPSRRAKEVLEAAWKHGIPLEPHEFVEQPAGVARPSGITYHYGGTTGS